MRLSSFFFAIIFLSTLFSQKESIHFVQYSAENGLSSPIVTGIVQDKEGFIWISTADGLNRFDGKNFKVIRNEGVSTNEISQNNIDVLAIDKRGFLWLGETNGIDIFNPYSNEVVNYQVRQQTQAGIVSLSHNTITAIAQDTNGDMWVGTENGLNKFDYNSGSFKHYLNSDNETSINNNHIRSLYLSKAGDLWVGTTNGLAKYVPSTDSFIRFGVNGELTYNTVVTIHEDKDGTLFLGVESGNDRGAIDCLAPSTGEVITRKNNPTAFKGLPQDGIIAVQSDHRENLWFGTTTPAGLYRHQQSTKETKRYRQSEFEYKTLVSDDITSIYIDRTGIIWVGTNGGGLNKIRYEADKHFKTMSVNQLAAPRYTLTASQTLAIFEDSDGDVWYGTSNGLNRYNPQSGEIRKYFQNPNRNSLSHSRIQTIHEDNYGNFWVGTFGGLDFMDRQSQRFVSFRAGRRSLAGNKITALAQGTGTNVWVGTTTGLSRLRADGGMTWRTAKKGTTFRTFRHSTSDSTTISNNEVTAIVTDRSHVWIGTKNGLNRLDPNTNRVTRFYHSKSDITSLSNNSILSLHVDVFNNLWVGTENGLSRYNRSSNDFKRVTVSDGLPNMRINGILEEEGRNNLWISTNKGLSRYQYEGQFGRNNIVNYTTVDGLVLNEFYPAAYHRGPTNKLYFGTERGSVEFLPSDLVIKKNDPQVSFANVQKKYTDEPISPDFKTWELEYDESTISFDIAVLDFTAPENNRFEYWMEGVETDWVDPKGRSFLPYNLNPGEYLFKVRAVRADGLVSGNPKVLQIIVNPPFWQATWFISLAILFFVSGLSTIIYLRTKAQKEKEAILEKEVFQRTKELRDKTNELEKANVDLENEIVTRRETETALRGARQETDSILANVSQGLFLLDTEFEISNQYSAELENIFGKTDLAKTQFIKLMRPLITQKSLDELNDFIELLFNDDIDEIAMSELNPLDRVELHFEAERGEYQTKHLEFTFRRIMDKSNITSLLVTARDITELIELQEQLKKTESKNKTEMEQLLAILRANPIALRDYLKTVDVELVQVSRLFQEDKGGYRSILEKAFRIVHNLKGNASMLDLEFFVVKLHEIEEIMSRVLDKPKITGDDFLPIILEINEINSYLNGMNDLIDRVIAMSGQFQEDGNSSTREIEDQLKENLNNVLDNLTSELNKKAELSLEFKADTLPDPYKSVIQDISIQLIRNSMIHGIEEAADRAHAAKSPTAGLKLSIFKENGTVSFNYRDDGQGLDIERIKQKAVASGKIKESQLANLKNSDLAKLIFKDGFTTLDKTSQIGGRGEGMSLIKDLVGKHKGKMRFSFSKGKYFELGVIFPLN